MYQGMQGTLSPHRSVLQDLRSVYISAIGRESEQSTNSVIANDILLVTRSPIWDKILVALQRVKPPRLQLSVLVVLAAAGLRVVESKALARRKDQVMVIRGAANIFPLLPCYNLVTNFSTKPVQLPQKVVIARGAES